MRNTLICTVGTSLLGNLKRSADEPIQQAVASQNWNQLALLLLQYQNSDRLCGAEINSITSICGANLLSGRERLIFLVSDTPDGKDIGSLLRLYYENSKNPVSFRSVEIRVLEGLRDDNVHIFQRQGLKNLVREISKETRAFSPEVIAINATGGYKAQISFAGMIGQALGIPVYYLFERFSEVIELPPQPISLDLAFWLNHYQVFEQLEVSQMIDRASLETELENHYFESLIDEEVIDDLSYVTLSAIGELFHERCRLEFAKQETTILSLIPIDGTDPTKKVINLRDDHGKDVLQKFAEKICRSKYVKKVVNSLPFNSKQCTPIRRATADGLVEFVLTWTEKGYGLCLQTTGRNQAETNSIALHLQQEFAKG
jgi:putative CRISPR-associated protein (TIGR02619 family)